ncbi:MAG: hypothetical protein HYX77_05375 [Acidobacteria bacterium]|nr:hypothetical protein [Acidobacteriota bacterium]
MATCPECDFDEIDTADHEEGDTLSCPECGKNLVVLGAGELDFADDDDDDVDEDDVDDDELVDDEDEVDKEEDE